MMANALQVSERQEDLPVWEPCLRHVVADALGLDTPEELRQASLVDDLGLDSLDLVEMMVVVEECFGVSIDPGAMRELRSYGDLVTLVADRIGHAGCNLVEGEFSACCTAPSHDPNVLVLSGGLIPYDVEVLESSCAALGEGSRVEVRAASHRREVRRWFEHHLDRLRHAGVSVVLSWTAEPGTAAAR
jgi:acyl carrier protein